MITLLSILRRILNVILFIASGLLVYSFLLQEILNSNNKLLFFIAAWVITAYIFLPRIHRFLTKLYVPDYFIGRVRTPDGILGDPVNCAVIGSKKQLSYAMKQAGWHTTDNLDFSSSLKMIKSALFKKSYPNAPVSDLFLFSRKQDLAFQQELNSNPRVRHHVRFWKAPKGWHLPGGLKVDWVGAATFDRRVGLSLFTGQITHKIAENTDEERDHIQNTLRKIAKTEKIDHFFSAYHSRNGGGDLIKTDGALLMITLHDSAKKR